MGSGLRAWVSGWSDERKLWWKINIAMSPLWAFLLIKLLAPFGLFERADMHLSLTDWSLGPVGLVDRPEQPVLLVYMVNEPPGWGIAYERLVALDPDDGDIRGQVIKGGHTTLIGLNPDEAWIAHGHGDSTTYEGFALPDLDKRYDLGDLLAGHERLAKILDEVFSDGPQLDLRITAKDGYAYRLTPKTGQVEKLPLDPPKLAPDLMDSWPRCRLKYKGPLIDQRDCRPVVVEGQALTIRSVKTGSTYYWHIARPAEDGTVRWEVNDRQLFGDLEADEPVRNIRYLTLHKGKLLVVAEDGSGVDDIYAVAIDVEDGRTAWSRTFW